MREWYSLNLAFENEFYSRHVNIGSEFYALLMFYLENLKCLYRSVVLFSSVFMDFFSKWLKRAVIVSHCINELVVVCQIALRQILFQCCEYIIRLHLLY